MLTGQNAIGLSSPGLEVRLSAPETASTAPTIASLSGDVRSAFDETGNLLLRVAPDNSSTEVYANSLSVIRSYSQMIATMATSIEGQAASLGASMTKAQRTAVSLMLGLAKTAKSGHVYTTTVGRTPIDFYLEQDALVIDLKEPYGGNLQGSFRIADYGRGKVTAIAYNGLTPGDAIGLLRDVKEQRGCPAWAAGVIDHATKYLTNKPETPK